MGETVFAPLALALALKGVLCARLVTGAYFAALHRFVLCKFSACFRALKLFT